MDRPAAAPSAGPGALADAGRPLAAAPSRVGADPDAGADGSVTGTIGLGGVFDRHACTVEPRPADDCASLEGAPAPVTREVERFLRRTAGQNSLVASEFADVVRARSIRVGLAERTERRLRVLAAFTADRGGSYRDTRGRLNPAPVDTSARPYCVDLSFALQADAFVLETPACVPGIGRVDAFRPKPVRLPPL